LPNRRRVIVVSTRRWSYPRCTGWSLNSSSRWLTSPGPRKTCCGRCRVKDSGKINLRDRSCGRRRIRIGA